MFTKLDIIFRTELLDSDIACMQEKYGVKTPDQCHGSLPQTLHSLSVYMCSVSALQYILILVKKYSQSYLNEAFAHITSTECFVTTQWHGDPCQEHQDGYSKHNNRGWLHVSSKTISNSQEAKQTNKKKKNNKNFNSKANVRVKTNTKMKIK